MKIVREWNEVVKKKGCRNIIYFCILFEYYCVMNVWRNEMIEVCVLSWSIVGIKWKKIILIIYFVMNKYNNLIKLILKLS